MEKEELKQLKHLLEKFMYHKVDTLKQLISEKKPTRITEIEIHYSKATTSIINGELNANLYNP